MHKATGVARMKEIQLTLYELFGYLLPGAVLTAGLAVLFWALFFPQDAVEFDIKTVEVWATFLVMAYLVGHAGQSVGNWLAQRFPPSAEDRAIGALPPEVVDG